MFDKRPATAGDRTRPIQLTVAIALLAVGTYGWWHYRAEADRIRYLLPRQAVRTRIGGLLSEGSSRNLAEVLTALSDKDRDVRRSAILILSRMGAAAGPFSKALQDRLVVDEDSMVRRTAALALSRVDPDGAETVTALAARMGDEDPTVRHFAEDFLASKGEAAVPKVLPLVSAADSLVRLHAIRVLQRVSGSSAETIDLLRVGTGDPDPSVRETAIVAVLSTGAATLPDVIGWIPDSNPAVSTAAIRTLPRFGPASIAGLPQLVSRLDNPLPSELGPILFALRLQGRSARSAIPALYRLVDSPVDYDLLEILETLSDLGADSELLRGLLEQQLNDESPRSAGRAATLLCRLDPDAARRQAAQLVRRLKNQPEPTVRGALAALRGLGEHAAVAMPDVIRFLDNGSELIEPAALVLAAIGPAAAPALPAIMARLKDPFRPGATEALLEAAGAIGPAAAEALPQIMEIAEAQPFSRSYLAIRIRCSALVAAARIGARDARFQELVRSTLTDRTWPLRVASLRALAIVAEPSGDSLPAFLRAAQDPDQPVRLAAAQTMANVSGGASSAVTALTELLRDGDPEVRAAAAVSLGRLGTVASVALPDLQAALAVEENFAPLRDFQRRRLGMRFAAGLHRNDELGALTVAQVVEEAIRLIATVSRQG